VVARDLLTETGSVFVQIGDENVHLVRNVLDEVFGSECAVTTILVKKKWRQKSEFIDPVNDYILWYSKTSRHDSRGGPKFRPLLVPRELDEETLSEFRTIELPDGAQHKLSAVKIGKEVRDYRSQPAALFRDLPNAR
jgi:adenine-specific DNA-methyltransferase